MWKLKIRNFGSYENPVALVLNVKIDKLCLNANKKSQKIRSENRLGEKMSHALSISLFL